MEHYNDIIKRVMREKTLNPRRIDVRYKKQGNLKGFANFDCSCDKTWSSAHGSADINLQTQKVVKLWKQACRDCEENTEPDFDDDQFEEMVGYAIERYRRLAAGNRRGGINRGRRDLDFDTPPHDSGRCERCRAGRRCASD